MASSSKRCSDSRVPSSWPRTVRDTGSHSLRLYARTGDKPRARAELDRLGALGGRFGGQAQVAEVRKLL